MTITIAVLHNQTLFDFSIQHTGNVTNAFIIAKANNISITTVLIAGASLAIPDSITSDVDIRNYYKSKAIQPATDITETGEPGETPEGISYWILNKNFIVQ